MWRKFTKTGRDLSLSRNEVSAFGTQMKEKMQEMMGGMMGAHMMGAHEKGGQSAEFNTALHADRHGRGDGPCGRP